MPIGDIPIFSMLRTKMEWHQERQRLLAENVANAETPKFRPRDITTPDFQRLRPVAANVVLATTETGHIGGMSSGASGSFEADRKNGYEVRPTGNSVNLEDQMMKVAENQMDYQAATTLYIRSMGLLKTALGKR